MSESTMLQKGSKNLPRKPHGIKGRIHPIRLFHNVWVKKQSATPVKTLAHNGQEQQTGFLLGKLACSRQPTLIPDVTEITYVGVKC
jgi:hypothetical protein